MKFFLVLLLLFVSVVSAEILPPSSDTVQAVSQWAEQTEKEILKQGRALNSEEISLARLAGVNYPENIRIVAVEKIPTPSDPLLQNLAAAGGMNHPDNAGQTLRYGILMRADAISDQGLLLHEFTHVRQFEEKGGLKPFIADYVEQVMRYGYDKCPLETEALTVEKEFNRLNQN